MAKRQAKRQKGGKSQGSRHYTPEEIKELKQKRSEKREKRANGDYLANIIKTQKLISQTPKIKDAKLLLC